jgi:SAM-dependent methyltransferase
MEFPVRGQYLRRALIRLYMYEQRIFDGYLGVSTAGVARTSVDVYSAGTENWPYLGCQWPALSFVLKDLAHDGTFVDLGAGKGKALLIAGRLPYSRVVGIEIDNELTEAAQHNIKRLHTKQRAQVVECVTASAGDWKVPDDTSVVFMHNPFFGATFRDAMANVFDSYDRNPREMHIVYMFPWEHEWLLSTGRVAVESVKSEAWPRHPRWWAGEHVTVIYHVSGYLQPPDQCRSKSLRLSATHRRALERWRKPSEHNFSLDHKLRASNVELHSLSSSWRG